MHFMLWYRLLSLDKWGASPSCLSYIGPSHDAMTREPVAPGLTLSALMHRARGAFTALGPVWPMWAPQQRLGSQPGPLSAIGRSLTCCEAWSLWSISMHILWLEFQFNQPSHECCEQLSYVTNNMKHIIIEINQGAHPVQLSCGYYTRLQYLVDIHSFLLFSLWTTMFCADTIGWIVTSQAHISSQFLIRTKEHLIFSWSWWTV